MAEAGVACATADALSTPAAALVLTGRDAVAVWAAVRKQSGNFKEKTALFLDALQNKYPQLTVPPLEQHHFTIVRTTAMPV